MKPKLLPALVFLSNLLIAQTSTKNFKTLKYQGGIVLSAIDVPGKRFSFKQSCTTEIDSIIKSGNVSFAHARIGKIRNCYYEFQIRQDTLQAILLQSEKVKTGKQVLEQAELQFGVPEKSTENGLMRYSWVTKGTTKYCTVTLIMSPDYSKATLTAVTNTGLQ